MDIVDCYLPPPPILAEPTSPPPTSDSELSEPEETTSFSFATLIGVFIVVLVIGVAVYVGVSKREQVHGEKMVLIV